MTGLIKVFYSILSLLLYSSDRTFVTERNETSGCASASLHGRSPAVDEVRAYIGPDRQKFST